MKTRFMVGSQSAAVPQSSLAGSEQLTNTLKTGMEHQVSFFNTMATSTLATVEKMVDRNLRAMCCSRRQAIRPEEAGVQKHVTGLKSTAVMAKGVIASARYQPFSQTAQPAADAVGV